MRRHATTRSVLANPTHAKRNPPTAGPKIAPACHAELLHVAAFSYTAIGTRNARRAEEAGERNARARPMMKIVPYMATTNAVTLIHPAAAPCATTYSPIDPAVMTPRLQRMIVRLLLR